MPDIDLAIVSNASFIFFLSSFIMKDMLLLRILYSIGTILLTPYFYFQIDPLWDGIVWNLAFLMINLFWIAKLLFDRRPVHFTDEQKQIWETGLHRIHPKYARILFAIGEYKTHKTKATIVEKGRTLDHVFLVLDGEATLSVNDAIVESIGPGRFIGSAMFLEHKAPFPSLTTIQTVKETRVLVWKHSDLRKLMAKDGEFGVAFQATLGLDIAGFVARAWNRQGLSR